LLSALLSCLFAPRPAHAYCRTTTCDPKKTACAVDEHGCVTDGDPLWWKAPCVTLWLPDDSEPLPGIDIATFARLSDVALKTWEAADCGAARPSVDVRLGGELECALSGYDPDAMRNVNSLSVVRDAWPYMPLVHDVALTTVTFDPSNGEILDADIELDAADNAFTTSDTAVNADLASALTHEAGHFLGLSHSDRPEATMFARTSPGSTQLRTLAADDEAAICAAYPPAAAPSGACASADSSDDPQRVCDATVTPRAETVRACSAGSSSSSASARSMLPAAAIALVLAWRRARRRVRESCPRRA
jgi:hypothetical protein